MYSNTGTHVAGGSAFGKFTEPLGDNILKAMADSQLYKQEDIGIMARVKLSDSDAYVQGGGGFGFFKIGEDGETKNIRLLYNTIDDIPADIVHRVSVDGKSRWVNCLRDKADDPVHICPLCAAGNARQRRVFLRVFEITKFDKKTGTDIEGDVKYWDRGNSIISDLESLSKRYSPLVEHIFEVERKGKRGDMSTSYKFYETFDDEKSLEDYPPEEDILGTIILNKTAEEMDEFIETGEFPKASDTFGDDERPKRDRGERDKRRTEERNERTRGQRHPAEEDAEEEEPKRSGSRNRRQVEDDDDEDDEPTPRNRRRGNRA